jgi:hypothetical protein
MFRQLPFPTPELRAGLMDAARRMGVPMESSLDV